MSTGIEWTAETWNPLAAFDRETDERGWFCTKVSPGCKNCYAESMNQRLGTGHAYAVPNLDEVELRLVNLDRPFKWQKSGKHCRVFVNSMTDLFHEAVPDEMIDRVFAAMSVAPDLTFQVLTKRPGRMQGYMSAVGDDPERLNRHAADFADYSEMRQLEWPPAHIWMGTSVEDQTRAEERVPHLLRTPAAVRFLSCEPLIGPVDLRSMPSRYAISIRPLTGEVAYPDFTSQGVSLDWIIVGGESGPNARRMEMGWAWSLVKQCRDAEVPVFVKQLGSRWAGSPKKKGGDPGKWPECLRVRQFPDEAPVTSEGAS